MNSCMINILILVTIQLVNGEKIFLLETFDNNTNLNNTMENEETNVQRKTKIKQTIHKNLTFSDSDYSYAKQDERSSLFSDDRLIWQESFGLISNQLLTTISALGKEFRISMDVWLEPIGNQEWTSVIHFTTGDDSSRLPAIYIGNKNKCLMTFAVNYIGLDFDCNNVFGQRGKHSHKWMYVEIAQKQKPHSQQFSLKIKINKKEVFAAVNPEARKFNDVKVYAGDLWWPSANGKIRNLVIAPASPSNVIFGLRSWKEGFVKGNQIFLIPFLGREFTISFDMYLEPKKWIQMNSWRSVVTFTTGNIHSRIPGVFIGSQNQLAIVMQEVIFISKSVLKSHTMQKLEMSQKMTNLKWMFEIKIDNKQVFRAENTDAQIFPQDVAQGKHGVHIYAGNPWYASANGYMKNFKFDTE